MSRKDGENRPATVSGQDEKHDHRWREYRLYILAGLAVLVFSGALFLSLQRLADSRAALYASRTTGSWVAYSVELEYRRFMDTLARYGLGDARTERSELMKRFDIFWSRVPLLVEGPDAERLQHTPQAQKLHGDLLAALRSVEPAVVSMTPGDRDGYRSVQSVLEPFSQRLRNLLITIEIDLKQTFQQQAIESAYRQVFVSFLGVLAGGGAMIALLFVQLRQSARLSEAHRQARADAVAASAAKSQFLARMTHELRTPLTTVIGYSELLMEEVAERGYHDLGEDLERIRFAGNHLLAMINDTLDLTKIETGRIELFPEPVDVNKLVVEVSKAVEPMIHRNGNDFELACEDIRRVVTDPTKLRQILLNLLGNAAKFTRNGTVGLRLSVEPGSGGQWLRFKVYDSGPGIPKSLEEEIFQPFFQGDGSPTRTHSGTGLGLAIVRSFCELMGGSIALDSSLGGGTSFTVRLPTDITDAAERLNTGAESGY